MKKIIRKYSKEILLHLSLAILIFLVLAFDKHSPHLHSCEILFFLNYIIAAQFINYYLLPKFFYKKKNKQFIIGILMTLAYVIIMEEFVFEKLFYPDSKGHEFHGVASTIVEIIPTMILFVGAKFAWDAQKKQREVDKLHRQMIESELQFLKSQINPHFLFNNLNNLYAYALENSPKTPKIILELSSLLRYMLYDCKEKVVPLEKELKYLENFMRLQELQIEDRGKINYSITGNTGGNFIAPMILIVFVENSFKHSTSSLSNNIIIDVEVKIENEKLSLICSNTYSQNTNTDNLSKGIGLENVKSRLNLLYSDAHKLEIKQENNIYKVELELEINKLSL